MDSCIITCHGNHCQNRINEISRILIILTLPWYFLSILPLVKPNFAIQENHKTYIQGWSERLLITNYQDGLNVVQIYWLVYANKQCNRTYRMPLSFVLPCQLHMGCRNLFLRSSVDGDRPWGGHAMLVKSRSSHQEFWQHPACVPFEFRNFWYGEQGLINLWKCFSPCEVGG